MTIVPGYSRPLLLVGFYLTLKINLTFDYWDYCPLLHVLFYPTFIWIAAGDFCPHLRLKVSGVYYTHLVGFTVPSAIVPIYYGTVLAIIMQVIDQIKKCAKL